MEWAPQSLGEALLRDESPFEAALLAWFGPGQAGLLARVNRYCRDAVNRAMRAALASALDKIEYFEHGEGPSGSALFGPPAEPSDVKQLEEACGQRLPSHLRWLLELTGGATEHDSCGYSLNPANTWRPLADWRVFLSCEALANSPGQMDQFLAEMIQDFGAEHFPSPPLVIIGEAPDDYCQSLTLNLRDGLLYHAVGNVPSNEKIGTTLDYLLGYGKLHEGEYCTSVPRKSSN